MPTLGGPGDSEEVEVTAGLLWVLANERNRCVLRYFHESGAEEAELEDLNEWVGEQMGGIQLSDPYTISTRLHHHSLPKLADYELIEYDPDEGVVRRETERTIPSDLMETLWELDG